MHDHIDDIIASPIAMKEETILINAHMFIMSIIGDACYVYKLVSILGYVYDIINYEHLCRCDIIYAETFYDDDVTVL